MTVRWVCAIICFFTDPSNIEIYTYCLTLSLLSALPISIPARRAVVFPAEPDLDGARQLEDFMQTATTTTQTHSSIAQSRRAIAAATLLFGLGLVFLTGFAPAQAVHNAAHDTRHAMAFPCH